MIAGMRWTDLPPDRDPADGGSVLSRGEWDDLRERLERLPPGHPSRPDEPESAGDDAADQDAPDGDRTGARRGVQDGKTGNGRAAGAARGPEARRGYDAGRAVPAGGRSEPYRPWFAAGESPAPWFAADPGN
jgi:hypothetical protein